MSQKTVVITGGTKGIGKALVDKFSNQGYIVFTCARNQVDLQNIQKENIYTFQADLSKKEEVLAFSQFILKHHFSIDILINNTGIFVPGSIHQEEEGILEKMINTNLYSAYHLTRALIPQLIEAKGHIFNLCSIASITPYANGGSYSISKYALYGMTQVLREEMKPKNVRVTAILPGATYTSSWEGAPIEKERLMKVEDVANTIFSAYELSKQTCIEEIILRPQLGDL